MHFASTSISNQNGELIFYTDGVKVNNRFDRQMSNGYGLNPGDFGNDSPYPSPHGCLILPLPENDSVYYMFHTPIIVDMIGNLQVYCNRLYYTIIDMRLDSGLGDITTKNQLYINDSLVTGGGMAACKHANGRDWWMLIQELKTNCFYTFLFTPDGVSNVQKQCIGSTLHANGDRGSNVFTPDGTKYIWSNFYENTNILDFDRCTGELSNYQHLAFNDSGAFVKGTIFFDGVSVSPNSRYLYQAGSAQLRQFDLWADSIMQSEVVLANTYQAVPPRSIGYGQLGPDGKIYFIPIGNDSVMHVIHNPDSAGFACNFQQSAIQLPANNFHALPYYPNYRLGALQGSACDTLNTNTEVIDLMHSGIKLFPNPANTTVTLRYENTASENLHLTLYDMQGRLLRTSNLNNSLTSYTFDVAEFNAGVIVCRVYDGKQALYTQRLVILK